MRIVPGRDHGKILELEDAEDEVSAMNFADEEFEDPVNALRFSEGEPQRRSGTVAKPKGMADAAHARKEMAKRKRKQTEGLAAGQAFGRDDQEDAVTEMGHDQGNKLLDDDEQNDSDGEIKRMQSNSNVQPPDAQSEGSYMVRVGQSQR